MFGDPTLAIEDGDDPRNIPKNTPLLNFLENHPNLFPMLRLLLQLLGL